MSPSPTPSGPADELVCKCDDGGHWIQNTIRQESRTVYVRDDGRVEVGVDHRRNDEHETSYTCSRCHTEVWDLEGVEYIDDTI